MIFFVICLVLNISLSFSQKLIGIIDLFRHGARTPLTVDSQGFDILNIKWEYGKGTLTNIGIRQHYLAGVNIRDKYINQKKLIGEYFNPDQFSLSSTDVNRTLVSAYSRILGIFPSLRYDYNSNMNFTHLILDFPQIVPVQAINYPSIVFQIDDNGVCKGFKDEFFLDKDNNLNFPVKTILKIHYYTELFEKTIYPILKQKLRLSKKDLKERREDNPRFIYHISDAILCAITEKKDISRLELSYNNITFFKEYKDYFLVYGKRSDNHLKIMSVPLMDKIIEITDRFLSKTDKLKYVGYSIHDKNLITFYRVLKLMTKGLRDISFQFASELIIEVYDDGTMKMIFNNNSFLNISINEFKEKRNKHLLSKEQFNDFCGFINYLDDKLLFSNKGILIVFIIIDCVLACIILVLIKIRNKNESNNIEVKEVVLLEKKLINETV